MGEYKLYKNAWISTDEAAETLLTNEEKRALLSKGGLFVRNVYSFDIDEQTSFWYVIKDSFGGLEELSASARRDVRKSLRLYNIKRLSSEDMLNVAYPIFTRAQEAYRVKCNIISYDKFSDMIAQYQRQGNIHYWGVESKQTGEIVAVAINTLKANSCEYNTLKCLPEALKDGSQPYYGLIYEMNRYYIEELGLSYVNDGARSLTNHSNIQPFLIQKFKFRKAYCKISVEYQWYLSIIVKILYPFRRWIKHPKVSAVLNMEAMVREEI